MNALLRLRLLGLVLNLVVWGLAPVVGAGAQEVDSAAYQGSPEEEELIALHTSLNEKYDAYYAEAEKIDDPDEQSKFYKENNPAAEFVPKLLEFESQHPGTDVGLMALRRIVLLAAAGGAADSAAYLGRREALKRLPRYADRPVLAEVLRYLDNGTTEPATEGLLRSLADAKQVDPTIREFSRLMLARWMISRLRAREYVERRLKELESGAKVSFTERRYLEESLELLPSVPELQSWQTEATELLETIAASKGELRQPAVDGLDPNWRLIRLDEERTKTMPLLTEIAEGVIFQQSHLQEGKPAPELEVTLLSGKEWSLAAQLGKVVIIQFSFKGCGPCEAMYPGLRELQESHADRISILSIMADELKADADESASSGKVTWNVHWDGHRGPLATRWAVTGFPTVYVVDTDGRIAEIGLRGEELSAEVVKLLE